MRRPAAGPTVEPLAHRLSWVAGFLAAQALGGLVLWPWIDPRFSFYGPADAHNHVIRIFFLDDLLRRGALFPRWWPDLALGYGYPLFNYYSPAAYYVAEALHLAGTTFYRSAQLLGAASVSLGAAGAFVLGACLFGRVAPSLVLAGAYVLAPYPFLTTLYGDGTLPQSLGLGLLPWLLAFGWRAVHRTGATSVLALAAGTAALLLTHSLTALLAAGMLVPWLFGAALDRPRRDRGAGVARALSGVGLGLAIGGFVWLPALTEQSAVHVELGRLPYLRFERSLWPLPLDLHWSYPRPRSSSSDSPKASVAQAVFLVGSSLAGGATWVARRQDRTDGGRAAGGARQTTFPRHTVAAAGVVAVATWFLNATWSHRIWEIAPLLANIQFAWRLWGPFALAVAVVGAGMFAGSAAAGRPQWPLATLLTGFVAVNALTLRPPPPAPGAAVPVSPGAAAARSDEESNLVAVAGTTSTGEFLPRSVVFGAPPDTFGGSRDAYEQRFPSGGWIAGRLWPYAGAVRVRQVWDAPASTRAEVEVLGDAPAVIGFRTLVFPGWRAYVDGRRAPIETPAVDPQTRLAHGFALVSVPPGVHTVELALGSTPPRTVGAIASIIGTGLAVAMLCRRVAAGPPATGLTIAIGAITLAASVGCAADHVRTLRSPPPPAPWSGRRAAPSVVLDVTGAVLAGSARIVSADDGPPDARAGARAQQPGGHERLWVAMHPPAELTFDVLVPDRTVFQAGLGLDAQSWQGSAAGEVRFVLEVADGDGSRAVLLDETLRPHVRPADRGWRFVLADLGPYARRRVTLVLRTEGRDIPVAGKAGWADATLYVDRSARYPPPAPLASPPPAAP